MTLSERENMVKIFNYFICILGIVCKVTPKDNLEIFYAAKKIRLSGLTEIEKDK